MNKETIAIIDYKIGNIISIKNGFNLINIDTYVSDNPDEIEKFNKIVLIGVGSFPSAMSNLNSFGFTKLIKNHIKKGGYLLGICVGMQLLMSQGYEFQATKGLDLITGTVDKMDKNRKIKLPHVGWNNFEKKININLFNSIDIESNYYFVHSYSINVNDRQAKTMNFNYSGENYIGAIQKNKIYGFQFHPEKSQEPGLKLLKNFYNL